MVGFSDCSGTNELIQDECNGLLVFGEDRSLAMAQALERLIDDVALRERLGLAGVESVKIYAPEAIVERWEEIIEMSVR